MVWLKQEWLGCKSSSNTSVIFPKCLSGHSFDHQEMSECFYSYFRRETCVCGQFSGFAVAFGITKARSCLLVQDLIFISQQLLKLYQSVTPPFWSRLKNLTEQFLKQYFMDYPEIWGRRSWCPGDDVYWFWFYPRLFLKSHQQVKIFIFIEKIPQHNHGL